MICSKLENTSRNLINKCSEKYGNGYIYIITLARILKLKIQMGGQNIFFNTTLPTPYLRWRTDYEV